MPRLGQPGVSDTDTTATIRIIGFDLGSGATVYMRWRQSGVSSWTNTSAFITTSRPQAVWNLSGLTAVTQYFYEISLDSSFPNSKRFTDQYRSSSFVTDERDIPLPSISTSGVTSITENGATLVAAISNPVAVGTTVYFRYRQDGATAWIATARTATPRSSVATRVITGLFPNVRYQYQISLSSSYTGATSRTFTTDRLVPTLGTISATTQMFSARITANVNNPFAVGTTVYLRYRVLGTSSWQSTSSTATPNSPTPVFNISGLLGGDGTTYQYEVSLNSSFTGASTRTFVTKAEPLPTLSNVTVSTSQTSATVIVTVGTPRVAGTTVYFRHRRTGTSSWSTRSSRTARTNNPRVTYAISSLIAGTSYDYQVSFSSSFSGASTRTFTTDAVPVVAAILASTSVTNITDRSAILNASVTNAKSTGTTVYFQYRQRGAVGWTSTAAQATRLSPAVSVALSGLLAGTQYQYQISLDSSFTGASTQTFTTLASRIPSISRINVINIMTNSADITANVVNAPSTGVPVYFRHRPSGSSNWTSTVRTATLNSPLVTVSLSSLITNTDYEYQVSLASNFSGARTNTFTPTRVLPTLGRLTVVTSDNAATIRGSVSNAFAVGTTIYARYRLGSSSSAADWTTTSTQVTPSDPIFSFTFTSLSPGTTYAYQVSLNSGFSTASSGTFFTEQVPSISAVNTVPGLTSASISVTITNAKATGTTVYFRHRRRGSTVWNSTALSATNTSSTVTFTLSNLASGTRYDFEASLSSNFSGVLSRSFVTNIPEPDPTLGTPLAATTADTATIRLTVSNAKATGTTVYFRHRRDGTTQWTTTSRSVTSSSPSTTISLTSLNPETTYEYEASLSSSFTGAFTRSFITDQRQPTVGTIQVFPDNISTVVLVTVNNPFAVGTAVYFRRRLSTSTSDSDWVQTTGTATRTSPTVRLVITGLQPQNTYSYEVSVDLSFNVKRTGTFTTTRRTPTLLQPTVNADFTRAVIQVEVLNAFAVGSIVRMQYRQLNTDTWRSTTVQQATPTRSTVSWTIRNLRPDTEYQYQVSFSPSFTGATTHTFRTQESGAATLTVLSAGVTDTTADLYGRVVKPAAVGTTVYARYGLLRNRFQDIVWTNLSADSATPTMPNVSFSITGLTPGTAYSYQMSLSPSFTGAPAFRFDTESTGPYLDDLSVSATTGTTAQLSLRGFNIQPTTVVDTSAQIIWVTEDVDTFADDFPPDDFTQFAIYGLTPTDNLISHTIEGLSPETTYIVETFLVTRNPTTNAIIGLKTGPNTSFRTSVQQASLGTPSVTPLITSATISVSVLNAQATGTTVYARVRVQDTDDWTNLSAAQATPTLADLTFHAADLEPATTYEYQVSLSLSYTGASTLTFATMMAPSTRIAAKVTGLRVLWDSDTAILHWNPIDDESLSSYSARFRTHTEPENFDYTPISNISSNSLPIPGLSHSTTYEFQVAGANELGLGPWSDPVRSTSPFLPDEDTNDGIFVKFDHDGDGIVEDQTHRLLGFTGRYGGTGLGYLDNVVPSNGQVIFDNSDSHYDLNIIRINSEFVIGLRLNNVEHTLLGGFISLPDETADPTTHLRTLTITFSGIFSRLAQEDGLTALTVSKPFDILTSEAINRALDKNSRIAVTSRQIDHGQVRMHNVNSPLISTAGLIRDNLRQIINKIALNEGGEVDEGRGDSIRFHSRFARELTPGIDGRYFSDEYSDNNPRVVFHTWKQDWFYSGIYTRVRGIQTAYNAVAENRLYHKTYTDDAAKIVIPPGTSYTYSANLQSDPSAREIGTVGEALAWTKITPTSVKFESIDGTAISQGGISVEPGVPGRIHISDIDDDSTFVYRFKVNNNTSAPIRIIEVEVRGEGIQRLTDFPTEEENTNAVEAYNLRRTLELGQTYAGAEFNGDSIANSSVAFMRYMLRKFSRPRHLATITWNVYDLHPGEEPGPGRLGLAAQLAATLLPGDVVNMTSRNLINELPPGTWFVEGGGYSYSSSTNIFDCTLNISQRNRLPVTLSNQRIDTTVSPTSNVNIGRPIALSANKVYIIVVDATLPADAAVDNSEWRIEDSVVQVVSGGNVLRGWVERDIPIGKSTIRNNHVSAIIARDTATTIQIQAKRLSSGSSSVTIERIRVLEMDNVATS